MIPASNCQVLFSRFMRYWFFHLLTFRFESILPQPRTVEKSAFSLNLADRGSGPVSVIRLKRLAARGKTKFCILKIPYIKNSNL